MPARAADIPVAGNPVYFQTQGPNDQISYGDYYSASVAQGGAGTDHMVSFVTPSAWPAGHPITVAIYDPESWGGTLASGLPAGDEVRGANDATTYWLVERPSGTTLTTKVYPAGSSATNGLWDQLITFTPKAGATYEIHTITGGDDENSWRARISYDPDCAVGTSTCTAAQLDNGNQLDDIDGISGTGDELFLNAVRVGYQHDSPTDVCNNHYFFVPDTMASVTMRNFDLDSTGTVTYTRGDGSTVAGTASGNGTWAVDTVPVGAGQAGWWTVQFCYNSGNLYVFESTQNLRLYMDTLPGAPKLAVTKTDGVTTAEWGQALNYTVKVANTSNLQPNPGSAVGVVVRDTIPAGLTYTGCSMGGALGSCAQSAGVVTWTLTNPIAAGASVNLGISTTVNWSFSGTVINTATADYNDVYGNNYPDVSGSDSADTIQPPTFVVTKTSNTGGALVAAGSQLTYNVQIQNPTTSGHTNVTVTDALPAGTTYVPGSTVVTLPATPVAITATDNFASGNYTGGSGWTGGWTEIGEATDPAVGNARIATQRVSLRRSGFGIQRTLSTVGATAGTLQFTLASDGSLDTSDVFKWGVIVGADPVQWIGTQTGNPTGNSTTISAALDSSLTTSPSSITVVLDKTGGTTNNHYYYVDDVSLTASAPGAPSVRTNASGGTLKSGVPETLVTAADAVSLAAGKTMTVTYKVNVTSPIVSTTQRYVTNTATVKSTQDTVGRQGSVTDELDRTPILQVVKTGPTSALVGDTVTYDFAVSHAKTSDGSPVSSVTIADNVAGTPTYVSGDDGNGLLESGETWIYTKNYTILAGDPRPLVNTVTVGGTDVNGQAIPTATANHSTAVAAPAPSISLTKTTPDALVAGGTIHYLLTAKNTGNVTLTGVQISEGLAGVTVVGTCPAVTLAPAASTSCNFTYVASQADVDAGSLTNSASVTGKPPTGGNVTKSAAVTLNAAPAPAISLTKTTPDALVAGGTIHYLLTAKNTGNVTLTGVQISENLGGATVVGTCPAVTLAPNAAASCNFTYVASQTDVDSGSLTNSASVVGTPPTGDPVKDTDAVTLTASSGPGITLTKTTSDTLTADGTITYLLTAKNTGNVTLDNVQISDGLDGVVPVGSCDAVSLAPGATTDCTFTYVASQADVDSGSLSNTGDVVGNPPTGDPVRASDTVTLAATAAPSISLSKTTSDTLTADGTITYLLTAKNTGKVTLDNVQISDDLVGATPVGPCDAVTLAPGAATDCTFTYTASQSDVDAGSLSNTGDVVGNPPAGDPVTASDTVTLTASPGPAITLAKTTSDSLTAGGTIHFLLTAKNTGNVTLDNVQISDGLDGVVPVGSCDAVTLLPGATTDCTFTYTASQSDVDAGSLTNSASVVGTPPSGADDNVTAIDAVTLTATAAPSISLSKTTSDTLTADGTITYLLTAKNTGNVTLDNVQISDGLDGVVPVGSCDAVTLAPGAATDCTFTYVASQADVDSGSLSNTGDVVGNPPTGDPVTASDTVTLTASPGPAITLTKTTSDSLTAGGTIHFLLTAKNTGNVTLDNVQISDGLDGVVPVGTCDAVSLVPGATTDCTFTYVASQADVDSGSLTNSASVVGTPPSGADDNVTATDAVTLTASGSPAITLTKTPSAKSAVLNDVVTYTLTARNTGNVTLTDVTVADSLPGIAIVGNCLPTTLAPGAELLCTAQYTVTKGDLEAGSVVNDATATGTPPAGPQVSASASATVVAVGDPAIDVSVTVNRPQYGSFGEVLKFTVVTTNTGNVTLYNTTLDSTLAGADTSACDAVNATLTPGQSVTCQVSYTVVLDDLYAPDKALDVVASGHSIVLVSVHAASAARATPVVALAFTGADVVQPTRYAVAFILAGIFLVLVASRSRRKEHDA
jgi:uncharacterized repeat protein (TIGR01451 family)